MGGTFLKAFLRSPYREKKTTLSMTKNRDDDVEDDFEAHDAKYAPVFCVSSSSSNNNNKDNDETRGGGKNQNPILLGEGNFGQARLMMNKSTGEKVAIKYIPRGKHLDENVVR